LSSTLTSTIAAPLPAASWTTCRGRFGLRGGPDDDPQRRRGSELVRGFEAVAVLVVRLVEPQDLRPRQVTGPPGPIAGRRRRPPPRRRALGAAPREAEVAVDLAGARVGVAGASVEAVDVLGDQREPVAEGGLGADQRQVRGVRAAA
jgi:hypothetical protein